MSTLKLPGELQGQITKQFAENYESLAYHGEFEQFKKIVPPSMISMVNFHLYNDIVSLHSVFSGHSEAIKELVQELTYMFLIPNAYLMQSGETSTFFSFVVKGNLEVWGKGLDNKETLIQELKAGEYCGELAMLYDVKRTASVKSSRYSNVGILSESNFRRIVMDPWIIGGVASSDRQLAIGDGFTG